MSEVIYLTEKKRIPVPRFEIVKQVYMDAKGVVHPVYDLFVEGTYRASYNTKDALMSAIECIISPEV